MLPQIKHGVCQKCGVEAPVKYVAFHRHVGMLVLMHHTTTKAHLCRNCTTSTYLSHTGITAVAGWWGILSFFITPFVLLYNTFQYLKASSLQPVPAEASRRAVDPSRIPVRGLDGAQRGVQSGAVAGGPPPLPPALSAALPMPEPVDEGDLDIAAYAPGNLKVGDRFGRYMVKRHTNERLDIVRVRHLSRFLWIGGFLLTVLAVMGMATGGNSGRGELSLLLLLPLGMACFLIWFLRGRKCQVDARARCVRTDQGVGGKEWSADQYYAVSLDMNPAASTDLRLVLAERMPTSSVGGTVVAACDPSDPECQNMLRAAAAIATKLGLPLRATADARKGCASGTRLFVRRPATLIAGR